MYSSARDARRQIQLSQIDGIVCGDERLCERGRRCVAAGLFQEGCGGEKGMGIVCARGGERRGTQVGRP